MAPRSKAILIIAAVALVAAFLLGFVPQYMRANRLENELQAARAEAGRCSTQLRFSRAAQAAALMHLEVARKNFGNAGGHASSFFNQVRALLNDTSDPGARGPLQRMLEYRDSVTAALARGDAAAEQQVRELVEISHVQLQGAAAP